MSATDVSIVSLATDIKNNYFYLSVSDVQHYNHSAYN